MADDLRHWIMQGDEVEAFAYSLMLAGGKSPEEAGRKINEIKIRMKREEYCRRLTVKSSSCPKLAVCIIITNASLRDRLSSCG